MEGKTRKMIIIGSLTFLAVVVVILAISLPITLKNRGGKTNSTSSTSKPAPVTSELVNSTHTSTTTKPAQAQSTGTTKVQSTTDDNEPLAIMSSVQETLTMAPVNMPGLIDPSFIPSTNNLADSADMTRSKSKSSKN